MTSGTHSERCPIEKRRPETLLIKNTDNPKGQKRTFYTDGSGKKLEGSDALETGWAAIEVTTQTTPEQTINMAPTQTWKGRSPLLESVPRCEARAVLKCTQEAETGSSIQIHTDNMSTIQNLRKLVYGTLKQAKQVANSDILTQIKENIFTKKLNMMLE